MGARHDDVRLDGPCARRRQPGPEPGATPAISCAAGVHSWARVLTKQKVKRLRVTWGLFARGLHVRLEG